MTDFKNQIAARLIEFEKLYTELWKVSGFTPETLLEMFLAGYKLEAPDNKEHPWDKMARLMRDD